VIEYRQFRSVVKFDHLWALREKITFFGYFRHNKVTANAGDEPQCALRIGSLFVNDLLFES
jgi:hypothetical protein